MVVTETKIILAEMLSARQGVINIAASQQTEKKEWIGQFSILEHHFILQ